MSVLKGDKIDEEAGGGEVIEKGEILKKYFMLSMIYLCLFHNSSFAFFEQMNPRAMVVDEHLADVVMVYRSEIESFL